MPEGSPGDRNRRARTVLIVDDDLDVLEGLAKIVSEHGRSPLVAMNGRDALEVLSRVDGPCLILLDLFMPVMDGFQLLRALERYQAPEDYPVVVMTASNAPTPIHASVVARLNRPCPLQDLLWVLDHLAPWNRVSRRIDADGWNGRHSAEDELRRGGGRGEGWWPGGEPEVLEDGPGQWRRLKEDGDYAAGATEACAVEDVGTERPAEELGPGDGAPGTVRRGGG